MIILGSVALLPLVKATYVSVTVPATNIGSSFQSGGMFCVWLWTVCLLYKCRIIGACSHTVTCLHKNTFTNMYICTSMLKNKQK